MEPSPSRQIAETRVSGRVSVWKYVCVCATYNTQWCRPPAIRPFRYRREYMYARLCKLTEQVGCPLGRVIISQIAVNVAQEHDCQVIAHGCTGKGNDQVRFEGYITTINPKLKVCLYTSKHVCMYMYWEDVDTYTSKSK